jgi:hypothetical protein
MIKEISAYLQVFRSQKMAALLFLGFASGLPLFLTSRTLQAWMTTEGVDLKSIGLFSLVTLPYSRSLCSSFSWSSSRLDFNRSSLFNFSDWFYGFSTTKTIFGIIGN